MAIEAGFTLATRWIALGIEAAAALVLTVGAAEALVRVLATMARRGTTLGAKRVIWLHFARWLVLALEFELAADIVRTAISPSWDDIGQLAAIAGIRTMLSYFLARDMADAASAPTRADAVATSAAT